jgi:hypothetical protein
MANCFNSSHKDRVNKLFTILTLALLPSPVLAAGVALPATVMILNPTADVTAPIHLPTRPRGGMTLHGQAGQMIRYTIGHVTGLVILDAEGVGTVRLPKDIAANAEYMLSYD